MSLRVSSQRSIISPYKLYYLLLRAGHALSSSENDTQHNKKLPPATAGINHTERILCAKPKSIRASINASIHVSTGANE